MRAEFAKAEFEALRAEILGTQRRSFQVIGVGALLIPGVNYIVHTKAEVLATGLPVLVVIVVLIYLADTHAITRCGRYIREHLEKEAYGADGGWEQWLQRKGSDNWWSDRTAERYMTAAVSLLFISYFSVATWLAYDYLFQFSPTGAVALHSFYTLIGAWLAVHLKRSLPLSTEPVQLPSTFHTVFVGMDQPMLLLLKKRLRRAASNQAHDEGDNMVHPDPGPR